MGSGLEIKRGATFYQVCYYEDLNGEVAPLTDVISIEFVMLSGDDRIEIDTGVLSTEDGTFYLSATAAETAVMPVKTYQYDAAFVASNGDVRKTDTRLIEVISSPTNSPE